MGYIFDQRDVETYEARCHTEAGREYFRLQREFILRMLRPRPNERLLDVGCGTGVHLQLFRRQGVTSTGLDPSRPALDRAEQRLGHRAGLFSGRAEDLPFDDNEFDIVTLINSLEYTDSPRAALAEAFRVARSRVFIGVLNSLSLTGLGVRVGGLVPHRRSREPRTYNLWELCGLVRTLSGSTRQRWGTLGLLPNALSGHIAFIESQRVLQQCPFGGFLGVTVDVVFKYRTDNLAVDQILKFRANAAHTGPATGMTFHPQRPATDNRAIFPEAG